jgi:succinate dehydrogenase/fumarate reductase flavoprotein subunit
MSGPNAEKIREELERLMREQVESLQRQTYLGITPEELQQEKARLQRIRELSADYLEALTTESS